MTEIERLLREAIDEVGSDWMAFTPSKWSRTRLALNAIETLSNYERTDTGHRLASVTEALDEADRAMAGPTAPITDCGDNSCLYATTRGGMRTNGGCRCDTCPACGGTVRPLRPQTHHEWCPQKAWIPEHHRTSPGKP